MPMYGSTQLPYRYNQDGQDDALARRPRQGTPMQSPAVAPKPVPPIPQGAAPQTFAQMQAAGMARPPMPSASASSSTVAPSGPSTILTEYAGTLNGAPTTSVPSDAPPTTNATGASNNFDVMQYILRQLEWGYTNPYDSTAVQREYDTLAQNIDDQYATNQRRTNESFAKQGLYGSSGKDFNSGRLADLNVGQRTAKTALASDLAQKYADTAGRFQESQNARDIGWLNALTGFGQQAFENDVTTNELNRRADESERDYLLRLAQYASGG